ncbi:MAG: RNA polymerase sigma factor [Candidatus Latescibacterota bacterium]|nr:RNA polymerase sigma factor [Candidatus Latescibacterota bacterium]
MDELIQKARQGDDEAFRSVYEQTSARVYAFCLRMMKDETRARDMTQDTYVRAWQHLETYRGESAFTTWLHTIATNACLVALRRRRRRREGDTEIEELEAMPGSNPGDPVDRIALERAIADLPDGARTVLLLHDIHGYRHDEIAQMTSTRPGTSKAHLHRVRKLLREALSR